jgi:tagatose 6-phosphate kinase
MVFPKLALDSVNRASSTLDGAAGKAVNVAKVLKALGDESVVTGFLGGERGRYLRGILTSQGVKMDFVEVSAHTRQCLTILDQATGAVTELVEESRPVEPTEYDRLLEVVRSRLSNCRAIVLSGTITPGGPVDFYFRCVQLAKEAGALVIVDAQGPLMLEALRAQPDLVKPNRTELAASLGRRIDSEEAIISAMKELNARGAQRVVITSGKNATLAFDGRACWRIHPPGIQAVNPIGSGDACTAALAWRLLRGDELGEACRWGAAAGAANALTLMAGELARTEVDRLASQVEIGRI